jgi:HEAT repeat protein
VRYADSADADIRESLAKACGRLGGLEQVDLLLRLLSDRVWWVRYRAAQALLGLKGMDSARLATLRDGLADRFARDMLEQARAEAELA